MIEHGRSRRDTTLHDRGERRAVHRLHRVAIAVLVLATGLALSPTDSATAQDAAPPTPILWSGRLVTKAGKATQGEITAVVRPPAGAVPDVGAVDAKASRLQSIPLATTVADTAGNFEIRATLDRAQLPKGWVDGSGGLTVMLFAVSQNGDWTVALDTVWYLDDPGTSPGWFTSRQNYDAARRVAATPDSAMRASLAQDLTQADAAEAAAGDRPLVLRANLPAVAAPHSASGLQTASVAPGSPYVGCSVVQTVSASTQYRTATMVDLATYWLHKVDYRTSGTTSWEVGYSPTSAGNTWSAAGSATFSATSSQGVYGEIYSGSNPNYLDTVRMNTKIKNLQWRCGTTSNPGPYYVYTAEAYGLTWESSRTFSGADIPCNTAYLHKVAPQFGYWRDGGNSNSLWGNVGIWGFYGGQRVTTSQTARYDWFNDSQLYDRHICGESAPVETGNTRVSALAT